VNRRGPSLATLRWRRDHAKAGPAPVYEHPTGSQAIVTDDLGNQWNTITMSQPWEVGIGSPEPRTLILIEGIHGGYAIERVQFRPHDPALKSFWERGGPGAIKPRRVDP